MPHDLKSSPRFSITLYIDTSFYFMECFKIIFKRQPLSSHVPFLGWETKGLLRGVLYFMTMEKEHSSLIGIYGREFHVIGFQRLKVLEQGRLITSLKDRGADRNHRGLDANTGHSQNLGTTGVFLRSYYSHQ